MTDDELLQAARAVREQAYCPYSKFRVGAALLDDAGHLHVSCNVENGVYPLTSCAEAGAISAMVASGGKRTVTIAVAGSGEKKPGCPPCGGCRQRILEFADSATRIIFKDNDGQWQSFSIDELLPQSFHL
jgi:cytidine deaminase